MKIPDTGKILSGVYLAGALIALFIVYRILASVGIIKTASRKKELAAREAASEALRTFDYFDPLFLKGRTDGYTALKTDIASRYSSQLRKAMVGIGTDEEAIFSVFGRLRCKYNISEVSLHYAENFKRDLLTDILNELTAKEQVTLVDIIENLPTKN